MDKELNENKKSCGFKNFVLSKHNIFSIVAIVSGILAIILFLVLPSVAFELTPEGVSASKVVPEMVGYRETLTGAQVLFGGTSVNIWITNKVSNRELNSYDVAFNYIMLIALLILIASVVGLIVMTVLKKNNIANKFILAGFIISTILLILTPVFFYAVNTNILPSTRYDQAYTRYEFGAVNCNADAGTVVAFIFGIIGSVAAGFTLPKADEDSRH